MAISEFIQFVINQTNHNNGLMIGFGVVVLTLLVILRNLRVIKNAVVAAKEHRQDDPVSDNDENTQDKETSSDGEQTTPFKRKAFRLGFFAGYKVGLERAMEAMKHRRKKNHAVIIPVVQWLNPRYDAYGDRAISKFAREMFDGLHDESDPTVAYKQAGFFAGLYFGTLAGIDGGEPVPERRSIYNLDVKELRKDYYDSTIDRPRRAPELVMDPEKIHTFWPLRSDQRESPYLWALSELIDDAVEQNLPAPGYDDEKD